MKVYMAGPLFTTAERDFNATVAAVLRSKGHEVFLPQEIEQAGDKTTARSIFDGDVAGIEEAEVVVACMDGPDPDSGTCWECGLAANFKPVIVYRTDIRNEEPFGPFNLMLHQSATAVLDCKWDSAGAVAEKIAAALVAIPRDKLV